MSDLLKGDIFESDAPQLPGKTSFHLLRGEFLESVNELKEPLHQWLSNSTPLRLLVSEPIGRQYTVLTGEIQKLLGPLSSVSEYDQELLNNWEQTADSLLKAEDKILEGHTLMVKNDEVWNLVYRSLLWVKCLIGILSSHQGKSLPIFCERCWYFESYAI